MIRRRWGQLPPSRGRSLISPHPWHVRIAHLATGDAAPSAKKLFAPVARRPSRGLLVAASQDAEDAVRLCGDEAQVLRALIAAEGQGLGARTAALPLATLSCDLLDLATAARPPLHFTITT